MLDEVYLCVKKNKSKEVKCKKFEDFRKASDYFLNNYKNNIEIIDSSTMIPVFKFIPFKNLYIWYKYSSVFIKIKD